MQTQKRGPKSQTLIMVPLSELITKLPANANIKLSRVWYQEIQETLGASSVQTEQVQTDQPDKISVTTIDFNEE